MMKNFYPIVAILVVAIAAGSFYGGMKYQEGKNGQQFTQGRNQMRTRFGNNGGNGNLNNAVRGEVLNADSNSLTVKLPDGSSKIILLSDKTTVNQTAESSKSALKSGEQVMVFGSSNSDGSVTAQNVQINPLFRGPNNTAGQ